MRKDKEGRILRPHGYIEQRDRDKNRTLFSDERFAKKVRESEEYDSERKKITDKVNKEIQALSKGLKAKTGIIESEPITPSFIHKTSLINKLKEIFEKLEIENREFENESIEFLKTLIDYCFDYTVFNGIENNFIHSKLLTHKIGNEIVRVSPSKNLFIVGNYGVGKTSIIQSIDYLINHSSEISIMDVNKNEIPLSCYNGYYSWMGLISVNKLTHYKEFEPEKYLAISQRKSLCIDFDDRIKERLVYGKPFIGDLINERYQNNLKTHIVCNYIDQTYSIDAVLMNYLDVFGGALYDRLFQMFNFIEVHGSSKRK